VHEVLLGDGSGWLLAADVLAAKFRMLVPRQRLLALAEDWVPARSRNAVRNTMASFEEDKSTARRRCDPTVPKVLADECYSLAPPYQAMGELLKD
jgi:hypothetical protein